MEPVIREARESDEQAIRDLDAAAWSPSFSPSPAPDPDARPSKIGDDSLEIWVAEAPGDGDPEIAGYVSLGRSLPMESNAHVLEVKGLNVAEAHKRKGIGRALLAKVADVAKSRAARKLRLRVLAINPGAIALYESIGYRDEGVLKGEFLLEGEYVDDHLMALDLTDGENR